MRPVKKRTINDKLSFSMLLVAYFCSAFFKISAAIVLPIFQQKYNLSSSIVGFLASTFFIPYAFSQIFTGPLCNKYGSHKVVAFGLLLSGFGTLLQALASNYIFIAFSRMLMGLGIGPSFPAILAYLQENFEDKEEYARKSGFSVMICNAGGAFASAPLKALLNIMGIRSLFILLTVIQFSISALLIILERSYTKHVNLNNSKNLLLELFRALKLIFRAPALLACMLIWTVYNLFLAIYQGLWCTQWTSIAFINSANLASMSGMLVGIGIMIGSEFGEDLRVKSWKRVKTVCFDTWLQVITFAFLLVSKTISNSGSFLYASLLCDVIYGITIGMVCVSATAFVRENTTQEMNSTVIGLYCGSSNIMTQIMQWLSGVMIDKFTVTGTLVYAFSRTFGVFTVLYLIVALFIVTLLKKSEK